MTTRTKRLLWLMSQKPKLRTFSGVPPLTFKAKKSGTLKNYRIYGNTVNEESVGDKTENLFDGKWENVYIGESGATGWSTTRLTSSYITLTSGKTYTFKSNLLIRRIYAYNNKTPVEDLVYVDSGLEYATFTVPNGADSIRIMIMKSKWAVIMPTDLEWCMLNEGSTAIPYEPYGYRVSVTVEGKNLGDIYNTSGTGVVISDNQITYSGEGDTVQICYLKVLEPGVYTISFDAVSTQSDSWLYFDGYPDSVYAGIEGDLRFVIGTTQTRYSNTYTILDGTERIRLFRNGTAEGRSNTIIVSNFQIEKGTVVTPYEPYQTPVTTNLYLPEQIKMVGDEAEYVDYKEQKQHRVRKNLLQNTATSQTVNGVAFTVNDDKSITLSRTSENDYMSLMGIKNGYDTTAIGSYDIPIFFAGESIISSTNSDITLRARYTDGTYLGSITNNVPIEFVKDVGVIYIQVDANFTGSTTVYPMIRKADISDDTYEPYIEDTELDVTLPTLPTLSGTNTLSVGTEVQPSNIEITGKIKGVTA